MAETPKSPELFNDTDDYVEASPPQSKQSKQKGNNRRLAKDEEIPEAKRVKKDARFFFPPRGDNVKPKTTSTPPGTSNIKLKPKMLDFNVDETLPLSQVPSKKGSQPVGFN